MLSPANVLYDPSLSQYICVLFTEIQVHKNRCHCAQRIEDFACFLLYSLATEGKFWVERTMVTFTSMTGNVISVLSGCVCKLIVFTYFA